MGLFGILKKEKQATTKNQPEDFNILGGSGMIGYIKSRLDDPSDENVLKVMQKIAEPEANQNSLTPEGDLPWGWHTIHQKETAPIEKRYKKHLQAWLDSRQKSPSENLSALQDFVKCMNSIKKLCEDKGECFNYWRDELFTDDYLRKRSDELKEMRQNLHKNQQV